MTRVVERTGGPLDTVIDYEHFDLVDNVWVAHPRCALPVAVALRQSLIELSNSRFVQQG